MADLFELESDFETFESERRGRTRRPRPMPPKRPWPRPRPRPLPFVPIHQPRPIPIESVAAPSPADDFRPTPVETPGGGRVTDKRAPAPADLVTISGVGGRRIRLHRLAARAWAAMVAAARGDNIAAPLLLPTSGFRDPAHQERLWQEALAKYKTLEEARKWVAPPGSSAHQSGRAIDFYLGGRNQSWNVAKLRTLPAYTWLVANAERFGFYPYEREPWHWEYNPPASSGAQEIALDSPASRTPAALDPAALVALRPLASAKTDPTHENALAIMKLVCQYHGMPWQVGYTILEHEGGVRLVKHHDGVMQTTASARRTIIPRIPRPLALALVGLSNVNPISPSGLADLVAKQFQKKLAVQIAAGVQELADNLARFNGYVALALVGYNAGPGWATYTATNGKAKARPKVLPERWERMCQYGASLLHKRPPQVVVEPGVWKCDMNIPAWYKELRVRNRVNQLLLVSYQYLRSVKDCIRPQKPTTVCDATTHRRREAGSGEPVCSMSRQGALDKLYDPSKLGAKYRAAAGKELLPIPEDSQPLRSIGGRLVKVPAVLTP